MQSAPRLRHTSGLAAPIRLRFKDRHGSPVSRLPPADGLGAGRCPCIFGVPYRVPIPHETTAWSPHHPTDAKVKPMEIKTLPDGPLKQLETVSTLRRGT